jgi:hypothetical protein
MKLAVHDCIDCRNLPLRPFDEADVDPQVEYRPKAPRIIDPRSTPRRRRCTTHYRSANKAKRVGAAAKRSRRRSGLDEDERRALWLYQGERCPCGRGIKTRLMPDADHDHELAKLHDHPENVACRDCMRGFLCRHCNRDIIGWLVKALGSPEAAAAGLHALGDYLLDPPMRRYLRGLEMGEKSA